MSARRGVPIQVVIADSGPLISLAACGRLDLLGEFRRPVLIPDVMKAECLRFPEKVGAGTLETWFATPGCPIEIVPTPFLNMWREAVAADDADPKSRSALGIGDAAVSWILRQAQVGVLADSPTLVLTEDGPFGDGVLRDRFPEVHLLSTRAFLRTLENLGRINSAEDIIADIAVAGRRLGRYLADRPGRPAPGTKTTWADVFAGASAVPLVEKF